MARDNDWSLYNGLMERDRIAQANQGFLDQNNLAGYYQYPVQHTNNPYTQQQLAPEMFTGYGGSMPQANASGAPGLAEYNYKSDDWRENLANSYFKYLEEDEQPRTLQQQEDKKSSDVGEGFMGTLLGMFGGKKKGGGANANAMQGAMGSAMSSMSDERAKKNVRSGTSEVRKTLDNVGAHEYKYKDPSNGSGTYYSPMAQELEKTKAGRSAVMTREDGLKLVNYARLSGLMLSGLGDINKRLKKLERK